MVRGRTVVVGAGLSGLACAFDLARAGQDVVVLEAGPRCGGVVDTIERDGFRFEAGPNTVPASAHSFRRLCADLGLASALVVARSGPRWLWFHGGLVALPTSPIGLLTTPLLSRDAKWSVLKEPLRRFSPPENGAPEPTLEAFLTERIGREATRRLAGAFVRGVYAAEIGELGARSAFPRLWDLAAQHGSLVRGALSSRKRRVPSQPGPAQRSMSLLSFQRGLVELVESLERALDGRIRLGSPVERIERFEGGWNVLCCDDGRADKSTFADHVVLCVPAPVAASLLERSIGEFVDLSFLRSIRHASITVVHLGFARDVTLPRGFGFLVPPDLEDRGAPAPRALGTIFTSNLFEGRAPVGGASVASFYRGADVAELDAIGLDDGRLVELAVEDLRLALRAADPALERPVPTRPTAHLVRRHEGVIPRYEPGHDQRMNQLLDTLSDLQLGLHLGGAFTRGVSVDHVIARGRAVAREVLFQEQYA
jgi:oxygen-dependent protoporphyrinogen oxidase